MDVVFNDCPGREVPLEIVTIRDQLIDYCDCLNLEEPRDQYDHIYDRDLDQLIYLTSILTCWTQKPCETFLNSEREEIVDLAKYKKCGCEGGLIEFKPFYAPFNQPGVVDVESMNIQLIVMKRLAEEVIDVAPEDFVYSPYFNVWRVNIGKYVGNIDCCCPGQYKVVFRYYAGYSLLPDCLLQLFCDLLHVVHDKNNCSCRTCQACKGTDTTEITDVDITYSEGDTASPKLREYLERLVIAAYTKEIGYISICPGTEKNIWSVVV